MIWDFCKAVAVTLDKYAFSSVDLHGRKLVIQIILAGIFGVVINYEFFSSVRLILAAFFLSRALIIEPSVQFIFISATALMIFTYSLYNVQLIFTRISTLLL